MASGARGGRRHKAVTRPPTPPPTAGSLLEGAEKYIAAACALIAQNATPEPTGFLASHGLELALKAYLLHSGVSVAKLKRNYGHNLNKLYRAATQRGLTAQFDLLWLAVLNHYHDNPFLYRYPQAGYAAPLPAGPDFPRDLRQVLQAVATALNAQLMGY
jgi:hypothetical protein